MGGKHDATGQARKESAGERNHVGTNRGNRRKSQGFARGAKGELSFVYH